MSQVIIEWYYLYYKHGRVSWIGWVAWRGWHGAEKLQKRYTSSWCFFSQWSLTQELILMPLTTLLFISANHKSCARLINTIRIRYTHTYMYAYTCTHSLVKIINNTYVYCSFPSCVWFSCVPCVYVRVWVWARVCYYSETSTKFCVIQAEWNR